jgi:UDP-glucose 4-epimerase
MKVFVTGGEGFIGSHVSDYLLSLGHDVVVIDNLFSGRDHWQAREVSPEIANVDILDRTSLSALFSLHMPQAVFHLAAHHYIPFCDRNPVAAYELNVGGTLNVLYEAKRVGVERIFFASTADVYASSPRAHTEDDVVGPFTVYGLTKSIGETICRGAVDWGWKPNILIGRIFNAVGTRETNPHLVPEIVAQVAHGATELKVGNLLPTRDFVDLPTQARAIVDATLANRGVETVNIGSGVSVPVRRMVDMILEEAGRDIRVTVDPAKVRAAERSNLCASTTRLKRLIGYAPEPAGPQTIRAILNEATQANAAVSQLVCA